MTRFGERADQHRLYTNGGVVSVPPEGDFGVDPFTAAAPPANPFDGMLWVDTTSTDAPIVGVLKRWNHSLAEWEIIGAPAAPAPPASNAPLIFGTFTVNTTIAVPSTTYPAVPADDHTSNYWGRFIPITWIPGNTAFVSNLDGAVIGHLTTNDWYIISTGPYAGAVMPKQSGWYYVTGHLRWPEDASFTFRSLNLAYTNLTTYHPIGMAGGNGLLSVSVTTVGSGYVDGSAITVAGGGGGSGFAATLITNGVGGIYGIKVTDIGTGYTTAPTLTPTGGVGGVFARSIPVAISSLAYIFGEDTRSSLADAPTQQTAHRLQYLTGYHDDPLGGTPCWMTAGQGSGGPINVPLPRGVVFLPLNDYFGALSLFKVNPLGTNPYGFWVPGLPE